jgi:hypothetical protein
MTDGFTFRAADAQKLLRGDALRFVGAVGVSGAGVLVWNLGGEGR